MPHPVNTDLGKITATLLPAPPTKTPSCSRVECGSGQALHCPAPAQPLVVYNIQRTRVYTTRDRGISTAVQLYWMYMCMCVLMALAPCKKSLTHDARESPALHEKSRWLYPFPWYEQDRTRVPKVPVPVPLAFQQGHTQYQGILPRAYRTY